MKKAISERRKIASDEMRPEYDFRGAVRGKFYKPLHKGYTVRIHKKNGTTVVKHFVLKEGAVVLDPDVREYFPTSEVVNKTLRALIALLPQKQRKAKAR